MKRLNKIILVFIVLLAVTGCGNKHFKSINYKEYKKLIDNKETFILEVMKTGCTYCEKVKPKLEEIANEYNIDIKVINTAKLSKDDFEKFQDEVGISGTPTIIFYTNGVEETIASRITGNLPKERIISKLKANGIIEE